MSAACVVAELRQGPATTTSLCLATGLSREAVNSAIRRANESGHRIVNVRSRGGHHDGLYHLVRDHEARRTCAVPGCHTVLCRYNRGSLCYVHDSERARRAPARSAGKKVPRADAALILSRADAGETHGAIAASYGCSRSMISRIVRRERASRREVRA